MLALYHGTTSVCAVKVRIVLAEKGLDWDSRLMNLQRGEQFDPEYLKLNPNGVVPTLIHDDNVVIESTVIMNYLDEVFPDPPMMPADPMDRARARIWMKRVDEGLFPSTVMVTFATANRKAISAMTPERREEYFARTPNPAQRERKRASVEQGLDAPQVAGAIKYFDKFFADMETCLTDRPWLAGDRYTMADAAVTSFIDRADILGMESLWDSRPRVADWYARIRERPAFRSCLTDWVSDSDRERYTVPQDETAAKVRDVLTERD